MSGRYNRTNASDSGTFAPFLPFPRLDVVENHRFNVSVPQEELAPVLLRIKISRKSYGRLQTNRAVAFPQDVETSGRCRLLRVGSVLLIFVALTLSRPS